MWTTENRARYDRSRLRYPSDLTDEEWALIAPRLPPARRGGNKRTVNLREVANGLLPSLRSCDSRGGFPRSLENDSSRQTRWSLPWGRRSRFAGTSTQSRFGSWRARHGTRSRAGGC